MPVPDIGLEKSLGKIRKELQGGLTDYDDGPYISDPTSLEKANTYQYGPGLNINSGGQSDLVAPHGMDEQSNYNQDAGNTGTGTGTNTGTGTGTAG